ncbi:MAG: GNAT family N-acetyltransferase [Gammaproteobacteria bacterium]|nr:GNAT family N-acetyltransferase [Gammaproteobacteria bacterium]
MPRTLPELYERVRDFFVLEFEGEIVGCTALQLFTAELGEVRSLAVSTRHEGRGFGRALVERLVAESRAIGLRKLMALTYVPIFFHRLGFETVDRDPPAGKGLGRVRVLPPTTTTARKSPS